MEIDADLRAQISGIIARHTGIPQERIRPENRLLHDLGIDGDDAGELLTDFAKTFHVEMSGFDFAMFFLSEPHLFNFWKFLFGKTKRLPPLTVDDLCRSAAAGKFEAASLSQNR